MTEKLLKKSPEINERFVDDFTITVPDARGVTEILQLALSADPHLRGRFPDVITTTHSQLIKCRRRTKTETRHSECLDERKIELQQTRKNVKQILKLSYLFKFIQSIGKEADIIHHPSSIIQG